MEESSGDLPEEEFLDMKVSLHATLEGYLSP